MTDKMIETLFDRHCEERSNLLFKEAIHSRFLERDCHGALCTISTQRLAMTVKKSETS
jgi:hypothetical protein